MAPEPRVVFEVLSPDTQRSDRTIKLADYNATPSIAYYVLVEQTEPLVQVYSRGPHGDFNLQPAEVREPGHADEMSAVGLSLSMSEIYEGVALDTAGQDAAARDANIASLRETKNMSRGGSSPAYASMRRCCARGGSRTRFCSDRAPAATLVLTATRIS
jgi:hypothetical protein